MRVFSPFNFLCSALYGMDAVAPSPPTPLPRSGGEGRNLCFELHWKSRMAPLAPGRGEGPGVRGEDPLVRVCRSLGSAWQGCFSGVFF